MNLFLVGIVCGYLLAGLLGWIVNRDTSVFRYILAALFYVVLSIYLFVIFVLKKVGIHVKA